MITNEHQLQVARRQIDRLKAALDAPSTANGVDLVIQDAQVHALEGQISDLEDEVAAYVSLRSGETTSIHMDTLSDLPRALIDFRIASGLTQGQLADRLQIKEQQIQRYESQVYSGASFQRIADIVNALGVDVPTHLELTQPSSEDAIIKRAELAGVSGAFIRKRLAPKTGAVARRLSRIYGWDADSFAANDALRLPEIAGASARFKMPRNRNESAVAAYTVYAHALASMCALGGHVISSIPLPDDAAPMRELIRQCGPITFENTLRTAWNMGVVVLPLADSGQFHGACWRINGVNVVVLKQGDRSPARWLIDLLHELFHASRHPTLANFEVVEEAETSDARRDDPEERQATWFASLVATDGRAEELFKLSLHRAGNNLARLKSAVARTAADEGIDAGVLANYTAYRLSLQGESWWATAGALQDRSVDPLAIARDMFFERFDFSILSHDDFELLQLALHEEVDHG